MGEKGSDSHILILNVCIAAASVRFDGTQHLTLRLGMVFSEAENLSFRFKTKRKDTFLIATRTDDAADRLEIYLGNDGDAFNSIIRTSIYNGHFLNFRARQIKIGTSHRFSE